jgi:two-component system CheB/CheR fusion protein
MAVKKDGARNKPAPTSNNAEESAQTKWVKKGISPSPQNPDRGTDFPIVGIGSSAGGLEALQELFTNMPSDTGMGFVVVSHLDPSHSSILPELLQKCTLMPVHSAENGMAVQPNRIYVIPPNKRMGILQAKLILLDLLEPRLLRLPIDFFLKALAQDRKRTAIGIILSGSGSDGALGLKEIKAEGGLVIVQEPTSARYDGMPRQALESGLADFVLRPSEIPTRLVSLADYTAKIIIKDVSTTPHIHLDYLSKVFLLLRQHTNHDFSQYKPGTLQRRIERRMTVNQISNLDTYITFLEQHKGEAQALFKDLLISVTGFFRDKEAFAALKSHVKSLISQRSATSPFRIWVPGCATGEEAYSIIIIFKECLAELNQDLEIQVFATDLDADAIERGRRGIYPVGISADISAERLHAFFLQVGDTYVIKKEIRERVVFAVQDFIKDPPFSKVDLICCRNLLIYLNSDLQSRLLPLLYYSLNPGGILFLGTAETTGKHTDLFSALDNKWKVYQRCEGTLQNQQMQQFGPVFTHIERAAGGQISQSLELRNGPLKMNILNLDREGFRVELEAALHRAFLKGQETSGARIVMDQPEVPTTAKGARSTRSSKRIAELERELALSLNNLQSVREEMETSSEELKSANEELQSTNEEMQSTNEELETSREELQSINEELMTVNAEQTAKNDELDKTSNDLLNLLNATEIATIFLDTNLNISYFTPAATAIFNLLKSDNGRPFQHITSKLVYDQLYEDLNGVQDTLVPRSIEVHTKDADSYILRIIPYRTRQGVVQGLVLNLVDITSEVKAAQELAQVKAAQELAQVKAAQELAQVKAAQELAESLVNTVREPLIVLDGDLRIVSANNAFYNSFQVVKEKTEKQLIYDIGNRQWDIPRLRELLEQILPESNYFNDYEVDHFFPTIGHKKMLLNARRVVAVSGHKPMILLSIEDITKSR